MGDDSEWLKLPTEEKVVHKAWKARLAGYEEALKLFSTLDEKDGQFVNYLDLLKKFVIDNNAIAQEKALDAVLAFVETAQVAKRNAGEIVGLVISKCLNATRAKTKDRAVDIILMYVEIDKPDVVVEELIKGLDNKQPKIVQGCVQCLRMALEAFGPKVVPLKPIIKMISKLLEDRDKGVRDEGKLLVVEIYKWMGAGLKPQLANLKPVQIQELEAEFEKLPACKPVQTRFMRSQQDLKAKVEAQSAATSTNGSGEPGDDGASSAATDIDPYDLLDPVEILSKLPKDFYEQVEAKKWQDRKDVLEACQKLTDNPKLDPGSDYGELVRVLCKVVAKDSNVMLVAIAAKCLYGLATGLRKKFSPYAVTCIKVFLEKFKEKKANVVTALREAIDAVYLTTNLEAISEDTIASLNDKNPSVKSETATFLARCCFARCTPATLPKKLLKPFCETLLKTINDMAAEVREAAFQVLGTAMKVVGEKAIAPFLADVDSIKMTKIKECCDKAELVFMKGKAAPAIAAVASAPAPAAAAPASAKAAASSAKSQPPAAAAAAPKKADGLKAGGATKAGAAAKPAGGKGSGKGPAAEAALPVEALLAPEVADEKAKALLTEEVVNGLANANWKDRLASAETVLQKVKGTPREELPTQAIVYVVGSKKPGLKDTNFQVLKMRLEIVAYLAQNFKFTKTSAEYVLADLVDKVGDAKNGDGAKEALTAIAEATDFAFVSQEVLAVAIDQQKNPKNQAEALTWLANAIKEFGFKVNVKPMVSFLKKALQATNPAVRTAAVSGVLPIMYMHMGSPLRMLFEDEKPALVQQIDAEFEKVKGERPPAPTRGVKASARGEDAGDDDDDGGGGAASSAVVDLIPRTDISGRITEGLLAKLADKNWKIRKEGLDEVVAILSEAKFITADIGALPEALKARLNDSNKILVTTALSICQTLAIASGPNVRKHIPVLAGALIANMGDSKPQLRQTVVDTLDAWVKETKLAPFVEDNIFSEAIKQENPNLRAALLTWLAQKLPLEKKLPADPLRECLPPLFTCLGDRNPEVRKSAQECLLPFMTHTGFDAMLRVVNKMDRGGKDQAMPLIEKAKEAWQQQKLQQQKQQPPPPPAAATAPAPAAAKVVKPPQSAKPPSPATIANDDDDVQDDDDAKPATSRTAESAQKGAAAAKGKPAAAAAGGPGTATAGSKAKPGSAAPASARKKGEEEDMSPLMAVNYTKAQRIKDEKALKVLKWNFPAPRQEFVDQLRDQMEKNFSTSAIELLFHTDFQRHTKVITLLQAAAESLKDATIDNLDIILKWMTLRFFDTNPSMLNKALEYLQVLFRVLGDSGYQLLDSEANAFVPYLLLKVGDSKDNVRKDVRTILKLLCKVFPASKMFTFIITGVESKNTKQRTECLEELGWLIEMYGINVCQPTPAQALKEVARNISNGDNKVRLAALNTIVVAHGLIGETVYKFVGQLNEKDMSMLEERIKRSVKKPQAASQASGPAAPAQQLADREKSPEKERPTTAPEPGQSRLQSARSVDNVPAATAATAAAGSAAAGLRRPATAGSLASMATTTRPEFTLGVDAAALPRPPEPRLVDHSELEALMREPDLVPHPRLRHAISQQQLASSGVGSPAGVARLLGVGGGSGTIASDVSIAVDLVISQVASSDPATAVAALAQIDTTLKSATKGELFSGHADQLLSLATLQLKKAFNKHLVDSIVSRELVIRLFRCLGATIISLCEHTNGALAREATCDTLKDLVGTLVGVVLDTRLETLGDEGVLIVRSINFVIVRVLEFADGTNIMSALVRLLHDCVGNSACSPKYVELVMKCLWKMTRRINSAVAASLRLEVLFMDFNAFLTAYPVNSWKDKSCGDTPLRTIKTLIHTLVKVLGSQKISSSMSSLESSGALAPTSELLTFLRRVVRQGSNHHMPGDDASGGSDVHQPAASKVDAQALKSSEQLHQPPLGSVNGVKPAASNGAEKKGTRKLPKDVHDTLAEIFKKIGSKENTKEGLNDLYDFRLKHPDADLEPFIRKSSQFFQTYIERGLKNIELERQGKQAKHAHDATLNVTVAPKAAGKTAADGTADPETAAYRERLQKLLARTGGGGAAGAGPQATSATSLTAPTARSASGLSVDSLQDYKTPLSSLATDPLPASLAPAGAATKREAPAARPQPDVSDLKARLERIKAGKAT